MSLYNPYGTEIKLTALPPEGTYFKSWTGSASGSRTPLTLVVTNVNQSYSFELATLNPGESALTIIEDGHGHVEVMPSGNKFTIGDVVTLTAVPDADQDFLDWSGGASGSENPLSVTIATSKVITANFTKRPRLRVGTPLEGLVEEGFRLTLLGEFGATYTVQGSTNLGDWTEVEKITTTYGIGQILDPIGRTSPWRFYRAIEDTPTNPSF